MKVTLYLGTDPAQYVTEGRLIHYPVIKIVPRQSSHPDIASAYAELTQYTHLLFTSKNAVHVFLEHMEGIPTVWQGKCVVAIGKVTAAHLAAAGVPVEVVAREETQEGLVRALANRPLDSAYFFMPRSSLSRPVLTQFFEERQIRCRAPAVYDTVAQCLEPKPDLNLVDEIVFTSPSTVNAFFAIFPTIPARIKCVALGPVTAQALREQVPFREVFWHHLK